MTQEKKELNLFKVMICAGIVIILLIIIIVIAITNTDKNSNQYKNLSILFNNEFIQTTEDVIIDENNTIYFSKEDVQELFDENIYYNEAEGELITTYREHIALLRLNEEIGLIDDEEIVLNGQLMQENNLIYIPMNELATTYDIEIYYSEETNRIVMDSTLNEKTEATIVEKTKVYEKKGIFKGDKLEQLIIGDRVIILEKFSKYVKIKTENGIIGYVKSDNISNENKIRDTLVEELQEIQVYDNYSNISGVYENLEVDSSLLNVVIPTFFYIDKDSNVLDKTTSSSATYAVYKNWADANGLEIMPTVTNNESVSTTLLTYSQRSQAINSLKNMVQNYGYVGINIEFNSIDDINSFYRFVLELYPRFKMAGIKVAITINNTSIDKEKIKNSVDYIIED